jgi:serine/threonine protein kinase
VAGGRWFTEGPGLTSDLCCPPPPFPSLSPAHPPTPTPVPRSLSSLLSSAKNLIRRMLVVNPSERITADEVCHGSPSIFFSGG